MLAISRASLSEDSTAERGIGSATELGVPPLADSEQAA
jgi:hypothetical protein